MERRLAVAYIRVSTNEQAEKYGEEAQRAAILDYADREGYIIDRWYKEVGCGAEERPILESILYSEDVENPPVEALIVYKQDRVARDMTLFFTYMYFLKKKGMELKSVNDDVDMNDPMWGIRMALIQMIAEQERKNITMRTTAGRNVKAQNGGYCGGRPPYGYRAVGSELEINEYEAEIVRFIFKMLDSGYGLKSTAAALESKGYVSRQGKPITFSTVRSIKENRKTYEGYYRFGNNDWVKGRHQPILEVKNEE